MHRVILTRRSGLVAGLALTLVATLSPLSVGSASADPSGRELRVGSVALRPCDLGTTAAAWCGSLKVPLDYTDASAGTITVGFGWIPSTDRAEGTFVAQEGGPGYPSTGTAPDYEAMAGSLLVHRNLLVVDARGTGRSTPVDCTMLQNLPSPSPRYTAAVTACGNQLNHTFRRSDGSYVHASDLFGTANAARDLARVLHALALGRVDLYGDSYGTYFAQSFLSRYPSLLRSVVLDSAYEARDLDPWYTTSVQTARAGFNTVCSRTPGCPPGSSWARIAQLAQALRTRPITGSAVGTDAARHHITVDVTALVNIINDAGYDTDPYRQLDAAARAYLDHRDGQPLLRLYLQDISYDYGDYVATPASYYSDGLYMAVACTDYPQLFSMRSPLAQRRAQLAAAIADEPSQTFAPFTVREWLSVLPYTETYSGCLTWPAPTHPADPPVAAGPMDPQHIPVLILNGELDSLTPAVGGAHIARQLGSSAHAYVAANNVHLVVLDSAYDCGPSLLRAFVHTPNALLNTSCLAAIPAIHAVTQYPATLAAVSTAPGSGPLWKRRLLLVALLEGQDALVRQGYVVGQRDLGLYGGAVSYPDSGTAVLSGVRFTTDTTISGTVHRVGVQGGSGTVTITGGGHSVRVHLSWPTPAS